MLRADDLHKNQACINGKWVVAKPLPEPFLWRLKDAWKVLKGEAEAVSFEEEAK